jgi:hypothetical protein
MAAITFYRAVNMDDWNFVDDAEVTITPNLIVQSGANGEVVYYHGTYYFSNHGELVNGGYQKIVFLVGSDTQFVMRGGYGNPVHHLELLEDHDPRVLREWFYANDSLTGSRFDDLLRGWEYWDTVKGRAGNDTVHGGAGKDTLDGNGGVDYVYGDAGRDTMTWRSSDFFDGGLHYDTLAVGRSLDFTSLGEGKVFGVERISMDGGVIGKLTLDAGSVLDLSSETDTLQLIGDAGDKVRLQNFTLDTVAGGFEIWRSGAATVEVEAELVVFS